MGENLSNEQIMGLIHAGSCFHWITDNNLKLSASEWTLKNHEYQIGWLEEDHPKQCFIKGAQIGAFLNINSELRTLAGWKTMGTIEVGDQVFDEQGRLSTVTFVFQIERDLPCYEVCFSDGTKIITDGTHRWRVRNVKYNVYKTLSTEQMLNKVRYRKGTRARYAVDIAKALVFPKQNLPIDPYVLGVWLGDGLKDTGFITAESEDIKDYLSLFRKRGFTPRLIKFSDKNIQIDINLRDKLLCLLGERLQRRIPFVYLSSSVEQRLELLRGLIDSDGYIDKNGSCFFYGSNLLIVQDVYELINSLGFKAKINKRLDSRRNNQVSWEVYFKADKRTKVSNLKRKYNRQVPIRRAKEINSRYIIDIIPTESIPVRCISVDSPSNLYLVGRNFIPTHNSECNVLKTLHGHVFGKYPQGSLYLFPTRDDVKDFSKARFDPLIEQNPFIGAFVRNTDSQNIKRVGKGFLYLRGARSTKTVGGTKKSSSQLKSISVDRVVFDEFDEMDDAMIELAEYRVAHSKVKELIKLGTPTIPGFGIDAEYQNSDQRVWFIECEHCGKETSLDLEFPNSVKRRVDGTAYRACIHCSKEVSPRKGRWIALYPDRSKDNVGWWISQLNSAFVDPTRILDKYENPPYGDLSEVMNSTLGRAYIPADNRLTIQDVYACCGSDTMLNRHEGPTCMGVDVGAVLHVVIGFRKTRNSFKIIRVARVDSFNDLHDLAKDFNVKCAVIDLFPEKRKVVEFKNNETFSVFGCNYVETRTGGIVWDDKEGIIKGNRTEICDISHEIVVSNRLEIPRRNAEIDEFARECCNIAKVLNEDNDTGARVYRYKKMGPANPDHYRHALNYALLASERIGVISDKAIISKFFARNRRRTWLTV